jgi:hypothetical protein
VTEEERREWQERLAQAVADTLAKKASRARFRAERTEARKWGKRALHARKLAHFRQQEETSMNVTKEHPKQQHATQPAAAGTLPWVPTFTTMGDIEHCVLCSVVLDLAAITLGAQGKGPVCEDCAEKLPDIGRPLWRLAEALDGIDGAIWNLPQALRPTMTQSLHGMLDSILHARIGPITDAEKAEFVAGMAAEDKLLRLPGGCVVKAAEYDAEKHGPFLP